MRVEFSCVVTKAVYQSAISGMQRTAVPAAADAEG